MKTADDDSPGIVGCIFIAVTSMLLLMTIWALIKHGAWREVFTSWNCWILATVVSLPAPIGLTLRSRFGGKRHSRQ